MSRCSRCGGPPTPGRALTAAEGERLCVPCTSVYLDDALDDAIAAYYGEVYRGKRGNDLPVTPRAWHHRGHR